MINERRVISCAWLLSIAMTIALHAVYLILTTGDNEGKPWSKHAKSTTSRLELQQKYFFVL